MGGIDWTQLLVDHDVVDLSVMVGNDYPCYWPTIMGYHTSTWHETDGWRGSYFTRYMIMEEHVGTHVDAPAHFIPKADSGLPHAGPQGSVTAEQIPLTQTMGPAVVVDCRPLRGHAANGESPLITVEYLQAWEAEHGKLGAGDIVLLYTGWSDDTYHRMPEGKAFGIEVVIDKAVPGWPAPDVPAMEYLAERGVRTLGVDTGSTGSLQDDPGPHWAGLGAGMVFVERLTNLGRLPARGAGFIFLGLKLEGGSGAPGRAIGLVART